MIVSCECGARLKIDEAKVAGKRAKVRCPRCGNVLPLFPTAPAVSAPASSQKSTHPSFAPSSPKEHLVLVAHDSEVVRHMVSGVLTEAGFGVATASDGVEALQKATELRPQAAVVDVGLPGIYGFELCERLKGDPATRHVKIVLLSSVYDMRRYKRTPASLYGADDYIEKHHIPDSLAVKLRKLISPEAFPDGSPAARRQVSSALPEMSRPPAREFEPSLISREPHTATDREIPASDRPAASRARQGDGVDPSAIMPESISLDASIFQKEECDIPRVDEADPEAVEKARRFARIIVSDIALYNQDLVLEGLRNGTFFALLSADVDEGRELYDKRVPAGIRAMKDYYQEAFDNFIKAAKRKNVR
jgi:predicted Zn finger-like uncharacterized protein